MKEFLKPQEVERTRSGQKVLDIWRPCAMITWSGTMAEAGETSDHVFHIRAGGMGQDSPGEGMASGQRIRALHRGGKLCWKSRRLNKCN